MALDPTLAAYMNAGKVQPSTGASMFGWDDLILGGLSLFGNLFGTKKQVDASSKAADEQAAALKYGADQQLEASREAQAYAAQQSALDRATAEANRQGNYDQWRAREARIGTLGQLAGLPAREIPAYVPLPSAAGSGGNTAASRPVPTIDPSKPIGPQVDAYFQSQGVSNHETPYWVSKWSEFGAKDPQYFAQRLAAADVFGGASAPAAPRVTIPTPVGAPRTLGSYAGYSINPALQAQIFLPPTLESMARG